MDTVMYDFGRMGLRGADSGASQKMRREGEDVVNSPFYSPSLILENASSVALQQSRPFAGDSLLLPHQSKRVVRQRPCGSAHIHHYLPVTKAASSPTVDYASLKTRTA